MGTQPLVSDNSMALVHLDERQLEFQKIFQENLRKMEATQKQREERLHQVNIVVEGRLMRSSIQCIYSIQCPTKQKKFVICVGCRVE